MYINKLRCQKPKSTNRKTISKHWEGKVIFFFDFFVSLGAFAVFFVPLYVDFN